jgi:L-ascorbate metabolism protein UlaG (beta-lactamase superfamily)
MNWKQAVQAALSIGPKLAIPMHYGTFPILEQDAVIFKDACADFAPKCTVVELKIGIEKEI